MLPSLTVSLERDFGVLIECSGTMLNFRPCFTFHLYLLHNRTSYLLSNPPLPEGRAGTAWGLHSRKLSSCPPLLNVVSHTTTHFLFSLSSASASKGQDTCLVVRFSRPTSCIINRLFSLLNSNAFRYPLNKTVTNYLTNYLILW
jgi:hypothetical protein